MTRSANHPVWAHAPRILAWQAEGLNRPAIRERLRSELGMVVGVDTIRAVLEATPLTAHEVILDALVPDKAAHRQKVEELVEANLGLHPCGRPKELVRRGSKKKGTVAGQVRPCKCLICGPVDGRLSRWRLWSADRYRGNYRCTGVEGIEGCGRVTWCAGPTADQMICRDCLRIPAAPQAAAKAAPVARAGRGAVKRGRAA